MAEVSRYKKLTAIRPQKQVLPIGAAAKSHSFATLFSEFAIILRHPFSAQLFSPLPCSSQLFSTTLTSARLAFTLLNLPQLFSPLATSSTLRTTSHLRSTHLTSFSAYLKSSHLLNSGQLFSTLLTSCHRDAYTYTQQAFN